MLRRGLKWLSGSVLLVLWTWTAAQTTNLCALSGSLNTIAGAAAANTRVYFNAVATQTYGGAIMIPSSFSVATDANGNLPTNPPVTLPQGATVLVTVGAGQPVQIQVPLAAGADLSTLLLANSDPASIVTGLSIAAGGDYAMSAVNPAVGEIGTATLRPGHVVALQGMPLAAAIPLPGQFLLENAAATQWTPASVSGDVSAGSATPGELTVNSVGGTGGNPNRLAGLSGAGHTDGSDTLTEFNGILQGAINVITFGVSATDNCATDQSAKLQAAINYAYDHGGSNVCLPVYIPPGCYLNSTLNDLGCSIFGSPGAGGRGNPSNDGGQTTILRGEPGEDIFAHPDPTITQTRYPRSSPTFQDLTLQVDRSVDASGTFTYPRRAGRTVQDGAMTSGSAVLTSTTAWFHPGDVGQAIQVVGASTSSCAPLAGNNCLNTTISSISGWIGGSEPSSTSATLAASASATVSGANVYIAIGGMPVTQSVGNCAFALPQYDGNSADWASGYPFKTGPILMGARFDNLHIQGEAGGTVYNDLGANNVCAFFFQGSQTPYKSRLTKLDIAGITYGLIAAFPTTNSTSNSTYTNLGDVNVFDDWLLTTTWPWVSYSGGDEAVTNINVEAKNDFEILTAPAGNGSSTQSWYIRMTEDELLSPGQPLRIAGFGHNLVDQEMNGGAGTAVQWDASGSTCGPECRAAVPITITGAQNQLRFSTNIPTVTDTGYSNLVLGRLSANPLDNAQPVRPYVIDASNGRSAPQLERSASFLFTTPSHFYYNSNDLLFHPEDLQWSTQGAGPYTIAADSVAPFGNYLLVPSGSASIYPAAIRPDTSNGFVIGQNIPAAKVAIWISALATTGESEVVHVLANATDAGSGTCTWSTSYPTTPCTLTVDLSSYANDTLSFQFAEGTYAVHVAWVGIQPLPDNPVQIGYGLTTLGGGAVPTLGTIGGSGPAIAAQNSWMQLKDNAGNSFWVPVWK